MVSIYRKTLLSEFPTVKLFCHKSLLYYFNFLVHGPSFMSRRVEVGLYGVGLGYETENPDFSFTYLVSWSFNVEGKIYRSKISQLDEKLQK